MIRKGYSEQISDRFILKIADDNKDEIDGIIELNVDVHGEDLAGLMRRLFEAHPNKHEQMWIYIKDTTTDKIISSGFLFPEIWDFETITMPVCEMGFVATDENYRGKGLFSQINNLYEKIMNENNYLLSVIRGVPFFYRRYNYEFAIPLDYGYSIPPQNIPKSVTDNVIIRKATKEDVDLLEELYNSWTDNYSITQSFSRKPFMFKYLNDEYNEFHFRTYIIEYNNKSRAFFSLGEYFGVENVIMHTSKMSYSQAINMLNFIKKKIKVADSKQNESLLILTSPHSDLSRLLLSLGAQLENSWRWQIKIADLKGFFERIKPLLEKRIKNSIFSDLNTTFKVSDYRQNVMLTFKKGKLEDITYRKDYHMEEDYDLKVPSAFLNLILLGSKTITEIQNIVTDALYKKESIALINTLFPKKPSYCYSYL
ncbi:MAG: GNAT family N-acetyltransferase [Candidatus Lokiarchaeota archaeon]|nr:GNAT family N-acetyltransferase [Candidatus Lokiarchaeota archaeon]MBD3200141.1 GNAT family N-acetyltransferase [Candidatus Lokiarchaeota archaeon]